MLWQFWGGILHTANRNRPGFCVCALSFLLVTLLVVSLKRVEDSKRPETSHFTRGFEGVGWKKSSKRRIFLDRGNYLEWIGG